MQLGMIGLGRMGANMVGRLLDAGHDCVVYDRDPQQCQAVVTHGALEATDFADLCAKLSRPRALWLMVPAGVVESVINALKPLLDAGDILIDGGNSYYKDSIRRARQLAETGIHWLDCGTSGGVWGRERGYCLMIGGDTAAVERVDPIFAALAPGVGEIERTRGREGAPDQAEQGYLHCGASGAGHFVKMVHNGIEYGLMAAYAEGLNLLKHAGVGRHTTATNAETAPLENPENFQYDIDIARVTELWRRGSVISSWLLDLTANALHADPDLSQFGGQVSDSGEGRWTSIAAIESGTPLPVLTTALFERFTSRGEADFGNQILSAMRYQFGGHREQKE